MADCEHPRVESLGVAWPPQYVEILSDGAGADLMQSLDVERRLSAIVAADVVGYSRLMETEEDAAVAA